MVQRTQRQRVRHLIRALLAVPAHVRRFDPHGVTAQRAVESAHRALVCVGSQNLFGEPAAPLPRTWEARPLAPGQVESGHVKLEPLVSNVMPLEEAKAAIGMLGSDSGPRMKVILEHGSVNG